MDPKFYENLLTMPRQAMESAIKGGVIIAVASTIYFMLFGGILGMSGMTGSLIKFPSSFFIPIQGMQPNSRPSFSWECSLPLHLFTCYTASSHNSKMSCIYPSTKKLQWINHHFLTSQWRDSLLESGLNSPMDAPVVMDFVDCQDFH